MEEEEEEDAPFVGVVVRGGGGPRAAEGTSNWICKSSGLLELEGGGRTRTNKSACVRACVCMGGLSEGAWKEG